MFDLLEDAAKIRCRCTQLAAFARDDQGAVISQLLEVLDPLDVEAVGAIDVAKEQD